jgi:hypothetical protein
MFQAALKRSKIHARRYSSSKPTQPRSKLPALFLYQSPDEASFIRKDEKGGGEGASSGKVADGGAVSTDDYPVRP